MGVYSLDKGVQKTRQSIKSTQPKTTHTLMTCLVGVEVIQEHKRKPSEKYLNF